MGREEPGVTSRLLLAALRLLLFEKYGLIARTKEQNDAETQSLFNLASDFLSVF